MKTKTLRFTLVSLALLVAPATAADPAGDSNCAELIIDSGRLSVMMDEVHGLLPKIKAPGAASQPDTPLGNRAVVYESLVSSVLLYNVLAHDACRTGALAGKDLCSGPYLPAWLGKPRDYTEVQLRTMIRDTESRLQPFWSAICAKAPKPAGDDDVCPME
jgi:hypothetical protein